MAARSALRDKHDLKRPMLSQETVVCELEHTTLNVHSVPVKRQSAEGDMAAKRCCR